MPIQHPTLSGHPHGQRRGDECALPNRLSAELEGLTGELQRKILLRFLHVLGRTTDTLLESLRSAFKKQVVLDNMNHFVLILQFNKREGVLKDIQAKLSSFRPYLYLPVGVFSVYRTITMLSLLIYVA